MSHALEGEKGQPKVSLLVAMKNESKFIAKTLEAILAQDYPKDKLEVVVADGCSTDDSKEIVSQIIKNWPNAFLVDNPDMIQSCGWNLGIEKCTGDIIGIVSAHCEIAEDYVSQAVDTIERTGADLVGGPMTAISSTLVGQAISLATSSPFGVGGARFHYISEEEEVDTVYQGLCHRALYAKIGGFDPEMIRNQDDELSFRIQDSGGKIICNPRIRSKYYNRSTLRSLNIQYFQYGFWKVRLMQKCLAQMKMRHFIPPVFASSVLMLPVLGLSFHFLWLVWFVILGAYMFGVLGASILLAKNEPTLANLIVPVIYPILHLSYGLGFLKGLIVWPFKGKPGKAPHLKITSNGDSRSKGT